MLQKICRWYRSRLQEKVTCQSFQVAPLPQLSAEFYPRDTIKWHISLPRYQLENGSITTSVYIKPTDRGLYSNFNSHAPIQYKKSIIKTLVCGALKYSSTWNDYHVEIDCILQVMSNNQFPQSIVEQIIKKCTEKYLHNRPSNIDQETTKIKLFVQLQNLHTFRKDTQQLSSIIKENVKPVAAQHEIAVTPFFRLKKLSSMFTTRGPLMEKGECAGVVYRFRCSEACCNAGYIGHTSCTLAERSKQHRYSSSSIHQHYIQDHNIEPPSSTDIINQFEIVRTIKNIG